MRAVVTVVGLDRVGIIAEACTILAAKNINILDIRQTVMDGLFTMTMVVDTTNATDSFENVRQALHEKGDQMKVSFRIQREDTFTAMYQV